MQENRRAAVRTNTKIAATVRLIENMPPHNVVGECNGVIIDAAHGGLKVAIPSQSNEVMKKLETGDYRVVVEASRSKAEKAEIVGHSRWSEQRGNTVVLGLRCPTMEPGQLFILAWVHGEGTAAPKPSRALVAALVIATLVAVVQTIRLQTQAPERPLIAEAPVLREKVIVKEILVPTPVIEVSTKPKPKAAPEAEVKSAAPTFRLADVVVDGNTITGSVISGGDVSAIIDLKVLERNRPIPGCDISARALNADVPHPFACVADRPLDASMISLIANSSE